MKQLASVLLFVSVACGSSEPAPTSPAASQPAAAHGEEHQHDKEHHHELTPELKAFHDQLAPRWHAAKGEARRKDTCAALSEFQARASAVQSAAPPASADPASWQGAGAALVEAVKGLATACGGSDEAAFETAFEAVHTRFHAAMELAKGA